MTKPKRVLSVGLRGLESNLENAMSYRILFLLALVLANTAACTEVVVEDHYGECTDDDQCPGTSVCLDNICVEPEEPIADCEPYEWAGERTPWHCWCEGDNCIGADGELPWECPLDLLDSGPSDGICGVQCHDHFWLDAEVVGLDPNTSPPSLTFDVGHGVVTCTQFVDLSPLRFVRSQTAIFSDPTNSRVVGVDFRLTGPGLVVVSYRTNQGNPWMYGGYAFTFSSQNLTNIGNIRYVGFASGTTIYWQLEARVQVNQPQAGDFWEGSQVIP